MSARTNIRVRFLAVFGEHRCDNVDDDAQLGEVCSCHVYPNVTGVQSDLAVVRVDDRRHGCDLSRRIIDDRVYGRVFDDMEIL